MAADPIIRSIPQEQIVNFDYKKTGQPSSEPSYGLDIDQWPPFKRTPKGVFPDISGYGPTLPQLGPPEPWVRFGPKLKIESPDPVERHFPKGYTSPPGELEMVNPVHKKMAFAPALVMVNPVHKKMAFASALVVGASLLALLLNSYFLGLPDKLFMIPLFGGMGLLSASALNILRSLRVFD